jgi:hypothetical protein
MFWPKTQITDEKFRNALRVFRPKTQINGKKKQTIVGEKLYINALIHKPRGGGGQF